ncbi:hypothetical protein OA86_14125 [Kaistella jeonii]|uniref:DUF2235 domain-containing protein n=1 Tax=Kaistella jeonii TaxID=266749 RepID=A0A0C1F268_9FLAO|nr:hypothetical protein OA86_14125 [Kaistella jeonii]
MACQEKSKIRQDQFPYKVTMPGVHSDIGGGYSETTDEKRYLDEFTEFGESNSEALKKFEKTKEKYISQGWYRREQFIIEKQLQTNFSKLDKLSFSTKYTLYGVRKQLPNTYQFIPFAIMKTFCEKYAKMPFDVDKIKKYYTVIPELLSIKEQLYNYAIANDGINILPSFL